MSESHGGVDFPTDDPAWTDTGEGGMIVTLAVYDSADYLQRWVKPAAWGSIMLTEAERTVGVVDLKSGEFHYGNMNLGEGEFFSPSTVGVCTDKPRGLDRNESPDLLAAIHLGSTRWSGMDAEDEMWYASWESLNSYGHLLIQHLLRLYTAAELESIQIYLITSLDT